MRVERFRARQSGQSLPLPFEPSEDNGKVVPFPLSPVPAALPAAPPRPVAGHHPVNAAVSHQEAEAPQIGLQFSEITEEPVWRVLPVAPLKQRGIGHAIDAGLVLAAALAFFIPLPFLGVPLSRDKVLLASFVCAVFLLALFYGFVFLARASTTPGMRFAGLRLVNFDGGRTSERQRLWRLFGVVVSGGSFLLGFLWAALDEEKLYWHDHISQTFLTLDS